MQLISCFKLYIYTNVYSQPYTDKTLTMARCNGTKQFLSGQPYTNLHRTYIVHIDGNRIHNVSDDWQMQIGIQYFHHHDHPMEANSTLIAQVEVKQFRPTWFILVGFICPSYDRFNHYLNICQNLTCIPEPLFCVRSLVFCLHYVCVVLYVVPESTNPF